MKHKTVGLLACPQCHAQLELITADRADQDYHTGDLYCGMCTKTFSIINGIPYFISPDQLTGFNRRFSRLYDGFSRIYAAFS